MLLGAACLAGALPAGARGAIYPVQQTLDGRPVLDGARTLWVEQPREQAPSLRIVAGRGGKRSVLHTLADPDARVRLDPTSLVAAGGTVAFGVLRSLRPEDDDPRAEPSPAGSEVLVGYGGGALSPLVRCDGRQYPSVALAAQALVSVVPDCEPLSLRPAPGAPPEPLSPAGSRPVAEGETVAWLEGERPAANPSYAIGDVVVYDVHRRAEVLRIPAAELPGPVAGLDAGAGGRVAVSFVRGSYPRERAGVAVAAPGEPLRVLSLPRSSFYRGSVAGRRIVVWRFDRRAGGVSELRAISGGSSRRLGPAGGDFDFDGRRLAWIATRCRRTVIRTASLRSLVRRPATRLRCRAPRR